MAPLFKFFNAEIKSFDDSKLIVEHFISTETPDRSNDVLDADGMILDGVPVVLKQHGFDPDIGSEPIAKPLSIQVGVNEKGVKGILVKTQYFDGSKLIPPDNTGQRLYQKAKERFMPYFSVRFRSVDSIPRGENGGLHFKKWLLLEYSQVSVPDNIEASVIKSLKEDEFNTIVDKRIDFGFKEVKKENKRGLVFDSDSETKFTLTDKDGKIIKCLFDSDCQMVTSSGEVTDDHKSLLKENKFLFIPIKTQLKSIAERVSTELPWEAMRILWFGMLGELSSSDGSEKAVKGIIKELVELLTPFALSFAQSGKQPIEIEKLIKEEVYQLITVEPQPVIKRISSSNKPAELKLRLKPVKKLNISQAAVKQLVSDAVKSQFTSSINELKGKITS